MGEAGVFFLMDVLVTVYLYDGNSERGLPAKTTIGSKSEKYSNSNFDIRIYRSFD